MKIKGRKLEPPKPLDIVLVREPKEDTIRLKAGAVLNIEDFIKLYPEPQPPMRITPTDTKGTPNFKDKAYLEEMRKYLDCEMGWTYARSLSATPGIEFEVIKLDDPKTCTLENFREELKAAGILPLEINYVIRRINQANAMDEDRLEEARKRFLLQEAGQSQ